MENIVYQLTSVNLSNVGGRMGSNYVTNNFTELFFNEADAKVFAEKDFGKKIKWRKDGDITKSPDLMFVEYEIEKIKVR